MSNIENTLAERGARYGAFADNAAVAQAIKQAMRTGKNWASLPDYQREALEMIAHKIGRMLSGDHTYDDNFIDIIGYTSLALRATQAESIGPVKAVPKR